MKVKEIRELSTEEINKKLVETKEELFNIYDKDKKRINEIQPWNRKRIFY